jgi:hypothetical protein
MKNKQTLKSLQQELDNIKIKSGSKVTKRTKPVSTNPNLGIGQDIKNSYIQRLYMRSSGFMLYLITGVIAYAHKIPVIRFIIGTLAAYYGKTTIWKILVKIRKIFIIINALLGVYMVFKTVGFSTDNLIAGFIGVGETYFIMLKDVTYKLFTWFVELFDHKIIPNVPGDNGGTMFSKPKNKSLITPSNIKIPDILDDDFFSLRKLYKDATPTSTPWYKETSTLLWIVGGICTIGVLYYGYCKISDPLFIATLFSSNPTINTQSPTPPLDPSGSGTIPSPDITLSQSIGNSISSVSKGIVNAYNKTINALNPFSYFTVTSADTQTAFNNFMDVQYDMNTANRKLYPFTEYNPYNSFFQKMKIYYFGESAQEFVERTQFRMHAERVYNSLSISKGKAIDTGGLTPIFSSNNSPYLSPSSTPATVIGLNTTAIAAVPTLSEMSNLAVQSKISAIAPTPSAVFSGHWDQHTFEKSLEDYARVDEWNRKKDLFHKTGINLFNKNKPEEVVESALEGLEIHDNKYSVLSNVFI